MQQPQENPNQSADDVRRAFNILFYLLESHAMCITMFIRHSFGINQPGFNGIGCLVVMFLFMLQQKDLRMGWMMEAWIVALIFQRLRSFYLVSKGARGHSYYDGYPWLAMLLPTARDEHHAKQHEPALCLGMGFLLLPVSPAIGLYVMFGAVSLFLLQLIYQSIRRRQVIAMRDMEIEQRAMSERMRGYRNDY